MCVCVSGRHIEESHYSSFSVSLHLIRLSTASWLCAAAVARLLFLFQSLRWSVTRSPLIRITGLWVNNLLISAKWEL